MFVPDMSLSCNECEEIEDLPKDIDSPASFLIKFKAENLSDPKSVSQGVVGFIMPENLTYESDIPKQRFFNSIRINHFNLKFKDENELIVTATDLYENNHTHRLCDEKELIEYLKSRYTNTEWQKLLFDSNKTNWKKYVGKILKRKFKVNYGSLTTSSEIHKNLKLDKSGFEAAIKEIRLYTNFEQTEDDLLKSHNPLNYLK